MEALDSSESFSASESVRESLKQSWPKDQHRVPRDVKASSSSKTDKSGVIATVPRYTVNLDLPASERWNQIAVHYKGLFVCPLFPVSFSPYLIKL
jgi:hypothetical protein